MGTATRLVIISLILGSSWNSIFFRFHHWTCNRSYVCCLGKEYLHRPRTFCILSCLNRSGVLRCVFPGNITKSNWVVRVLRTKYNQYFQEKREKSLTSSLKSAKSLIYLKNLFNFEAVSDLSKADLKRLQKLGLIYFVYLFIYSGLEFTLTFLTHHNFNYTSMQQGWMFFVIGNYPCHNSHI